MVLIKHTATIHEIWLDGPHVQLVVDRLRGTKNENESGNDSQHRP